MSEIRYSNSPVYAAVDSQLLAVDLSDLKPYWEINPEYYGESSVRIYDFDADISTAIYFPAGYSVSYRMDFRDAEEFVNLYGGRNGDIFFASLNYGSIYAEGGDDVIDIAGGANNADGGDGRDLITFKDATSSVYASMGDVYSFDPDFYDFAGIYNIEDMDGTAFGDELIGDGAANVIRGGGGGDLITGGGGSDTLDGGSGMDQLIGGLGSDRYDVDEAGDIVTELAEEGTDTVVSSITWTLGSNLENLTLTGLGDLNALGNDLDNVLAGNEGANYLKSADGADTLLGGGGDDRLQGGVGADSMAGGAGDDVYYVDGAGDVVAEAADEGVDTVHVSIDYVLTDDVERLLGSGAAGLALTGNGLDNEIYGGSGADTILGGDGDDRMDGRGGGDSMVGGAGDDTYSIDGSADVLVEDADGGYDTVIMFASGTMADNVERAVVRSPSGRSVGGNDLDNAIVGGLGADHLYGEAGDDRLSGRDGVDVLDGGAGRDVLTGGAGRDIFYFAMPESVGDVVTDFVHGLDEVWLEGGPGAPFDLAEDADPGVFTANAGGVAMEADDRLIYSTTNGRLFYDADGSGAGAAVLLATLRTAPALSFSDVHILISD